MCLDVGGEPLALILNAGRHTVPLSPAPVVLPRTHAVGSVSPVSSLRGEAGADGELQLTIQTAGPPHVSAEELLAAAAAQRKDTADSNALLAAKNVSRSTRNNNNVPPLAWLRSPEPATPHEQSEYEGEGAIVLVDAARFLPDDIVASGVRASLLDERGTTLVSARAHSLVLSDARMPRFAPMRLHLCGPLPPNATVVIAITAMIEDVEEAVTLGYAPLALFVYLGDTSLTQPTSSALPLASPFALNVGAFQLPLHPGTEQAFATSEIAISEATLSNGPRIPCATVLVRIVAGTHRASAQQGAAVVSRRFLDAAEHLPILQQQVVPPAPAYATGLYDSSRCPPQKNELALYRQRLQRPPQQALDTVAAAAAKRDEDVQNVDEADLWLDRFLDEPSIDEVYDLTRFAPYSAMAGVQLGVRCAAGLPKEAMSWTVASIFPPLGLYNISPEAKAGRYKLTEVHDFSADLRAPRWLDKASHLPQVPHEQSSLLVIDIRALEKPTTPTSLKPQGWTVLPVFGELWPYVHSGLHQLPLFEGTPTPEMLNTLAKVASHPLSEWQRALGKLASERYQTLIESTSPGPYVTIVLISPGRYVIIVWQASEDDRRGIGHRRPPRRPAPRGARLAGEFAA